MIEKQFKNLEEQIEIFKHKGMIINDERYVKEVLLRENYFFLNGLEFKITTNSNNIDNPFLDFNLFGMLTLSLSQIMKLEKMLIEDKTNSVKSDFSKSLVEILLFFGSLLFGASYMIQLFYLNVEESPLDIFYLIIRVIRNVNFLISSLVLQYRYYLDNYNDLNVNDDYSDN